MGKIEDLEITKQRIKEKQTIQNDVAMIKQIDQLIAISLQKMQTIQYIKSITSIMSPHQQIVAALALLLSFYLLTSLHQIKESTFISFQQFKHDFNKTYSSPAEQSYRKIIFSSNQNRINEHNSERDQAYRLGVTQFADLTQEEFVRIYLGTLGGERILGNSLDVQYSQRHEDEEKISKQSRNLKTAGYDIDWSSKGNVTPVRNQGMCGSCWAFSTTSAVQSSYSIYRNDNTYLSSQQLVDCSSSYGNSGCNGGRLDSALRYIKDHGLSTQKQYPYVGRQQSCKKDYGNYKISSYGTVSQCTSLYMVLHQRPIAVGVDASTWALYKEGILTVCGHNINHGTLLVGVADNYWKIKNSWGTSWGENGYIRIARGNTCGVCQTAFFPLL